MICKRCKKNFNYDKYYGICPKCGQYNSTQTNNIEEENIYERNGFDFDKMNHNHQELNQEIFQDIKNEKNSEQKTISFKSNTFNLELNPENLKNDLLKAKELIQEKMGIISEEETNNTENQQQDIFNNQYKELTPEEKQHQKNSKTILTIIFLLFFGGPMISFAFGIIITIISLIASLF